ncbi:MAG: hypothetical protein IJH71_09200 [Eubacterium sp.]|nr:hypothetical protein [Eubacterium sp.]
MGKANKEIREKIEEMESLLTRMDDTFSHIGRNWEGEAALNAKAQFISARDDMREIFLELKGGEDKEASEKKTEEEPFDALSDEIIY